MCNLQTNLFLLFASLSLNFFSGFIFRKIYNWHVKRVNVIIENEIKKQNDLIKDVRDKLNHISDRMDKIDNEIEKLHTITDKLNELYDNVSHDAFDL